jgi:pimeloyl-ACP methyl ester carboxylesterase
MNMDGRVFWITCRRAACALLAIASAAAFAGQEKEPALQRLSARLNGHTFAIWARVPPAPTGAIVLLHGRTWSSRPDFDLQVPGLARSALASLAAKGFAAYALDQRGYGETPRDRSGWITPKKAADDAAGALAWVAARHPDLPKPVLLGWSLGGATAHRVAVTSPSSLSALILYGYAPDPEMEIAAIEEPSKPPREKNTPEAAASDFISPSITNPEVVRAFVEKAIQTDPVHVDWKNEEQFICDSSGIRVPTLLLFGDRDPNVDPKEAEHFFNRLPAGAKQMVVFPGADHCAHLEDTHEAWIAAITGFLQRPGVLHKLR